MGRFGPLSPPLLFFGRFLLAAGLLFVMWGLVSDFYLSSLAAAYNTVFHTSAARFGFDQQSLSILYSGITSVPMIFGLERNEIFYLNIIAGVALFAATPGYGFGWRVKWISIVLALVWLTHLLSLPVGEYLVIWEYVESLPAEPDLVSSVERHYPKHREEFLRGLFDQWRTWGRVSSVLAIWCFAARGFLRLVDETAG